jgi:hypothetical protein
MIQYTAYLIVMCDKKTNAILGADIWSSPEWEQSRRLDCYTYVAFQHSSTESYHDARNQLIKTINNSYNMFGDDRYFRLLKYVKERYDIV